MLRYYKGDPNHQILVQRQGQIRRSGLGLSFWYLPHNTNILAVPATSLDAGFSLSEYTQDHQELHIHGSVSFRIADPLAAAGSLPFDVDPQTGRPTTQGRQLLESRVIAAVQSLSADRAGDGLRARPARRRRAGRIAGSRLKAEPELKALGLTVEGIHLLELSPAPELRKALEAEYRESLNKRADDAIYGRRFSAQQQEARLAKEQLESEISREEERKRNLSNARPPTSSERQKPRPRPSGLRLEPYAELSGQSLVGLALRQFAEHPQTIGQLSITPDLLSQLNGWMTRQAGENKDAA
jgi:hypothetical protein